MTLPNSSETQTRSIQAEFAATLVDEWARAGVRDAVISPGSRSSVIALSLLSDKRISVHMRLDERSGAFFAIGMALASGLPIVVVTTSGSAVAELHPAVIEADLARVPLIICTADRPVELHGVGAPQTIDQAAIFGGSLRYFLDLPVAEEATRPHWRSFASRLVAEATTHCNGPGPVHMNIAFREPMVGSVVCLPAGRADGSTWHRSLRGPSVSAASLSCFVDALSQAERGLFVVGGNPLDDPGPIVELAEQLGWPILADTRAIRRDVHPQLIAHADQFLRFDDVEQRLVPDLVVHMGSPHTSKTLATWTESLASQGVTHLLIDPFGSVEDAERYAAVFIGADPTELCRQAAPQLHSKAKSVAWIADWRMVDDQAALTISRVLDATERCSEPGIARSVFAHMARGTTLVCSSSMPVRDVEWFAAARANAPRVLANRGANGIDGVVSTVLGVAACSGGRTVGIVGDLAFFHDLSALVWGSIEEVPPATLVVVDNQGGGIFSFLTYPDVVSDALFERGFSTPQRQGVAEVARGLGCGVREVGSMSALGEALDACSNAPGISVIVCRTNRNENVDLHRDLAEAVHQVLISLKC